MLELGQIAGAAAAAAAASEGKETSVVAGRGAAARRTRRRKNRTSDLFGARCTKRWVSQLMRMRCVLMMCLVTRVYYE